MLRRYLLGQFQGNPEIPAELTRLCKPFAFWTKATWHFVSHDRWEWLRTAAHPFFDSWAKAHLEPGDSVISSYGYANFCFRHARRHGGKTFLDAGNSHPSQFWEIIGNEHRKWGIDREPMPRHWSERGLKMLEETDYVFSPSSYVTESFVRRGWDPARIFYIPYPIDLSVFKPGESPAIAEKNSPLKVICTGSVSVRKGFPYLLEAMRIIRKEREVVLLLTDVVEGSMKSIFPKYADVPIEWAPALPHDKLAERLRSADVFALLSLEDGFARTVTEAIACGLPAVVSRNTGALDYVKPGVNGEIVPICDPQAAAEAILKCASLNRSELSASAGNLLEDLTFQRFRERFDGVLAGLGMA